MRDPEFVLELKISPTLCWILSFLLAVLGLATRDSMINRTAPGELLESIVHAS